MDKSLSLYQENAENKQTIKQKRKISRLLLIPLGLILAGMGVSRSG